MLFIAQVQWGRNYRSNMPFVEAPQVWSFQSLHRYWQDQGALSSLGVVTFFWRSHFPLPGPRALGCCGDNNLLSTPVCKVNAPSPRCLIYTGSSLFMGRIWSINSCFTKLENKSTERLNDFLRSGKAKRWISTHFCWWLGRVAQCHLLPSVVSPLRATGLYSCLQTENNTFHLSIQQRWENVLRPLHRGFKAASHRYYS